MASDEIVNWLAARRRKTVASTLFYAMAALIGGTIAFLLTAGLILLLLQIVILAAIPVVSVAITVSVITTCVLTILLLVDSVRSSRDDMSIFPLWLLREYLHIGPRVIVEGFRHAMRAMRLARIRIRDVADLLAFLAARNTGLSRGEFVKTFPKANWTQSVSQLRLLDGVIVLGQDASRITLTATFRLELRMRLRQQPPRPEPELEAEPEPVSVEEPERLTAFEILGVPANASLAEIKTAYRLRVKECHPDRFSGMDEHSIQLAEEWTKALNAAYDSLLQQAGQRNGN